MKIIYSILTIIAVLLGLNALTDGDGTSGCLYFLLALRFDMAIELVKQEDRILKLEAAAKKDDENV